MNYQLKKACMRNCTNQELTWIMVQSSKLGSRRELIAGCTGFSLIWIFMMAVMTAGSPIVGIIALADLIIGGVSLAGVINSNKEFRMADELMEERKAKGRQR